MLRTHWVLPRGATRYCRPSTSSRLTGVERHCPDLRPLTSRTREPIRLIPIRVAPATALLKTLRVNQPGCWKRSGEAAAGGSAVLINADCGTNSHQEVFFGRR